MARGDLVQPMKPRPILIGTPSGDVLAADEGADATSQALLAYLVLPGGQTMGKWADAQLPNAYRDGAMPPLMLGDGR